MQRTALNLIVIYGLVGLAVAGSVVTVAEFASKVVPIVPRNGQLSLDLTMTPFVSQAPLSSPNHTSLADNFTLQITTNKIMVHRSGEFNLSSEWTTVLNSTKTFTLKQGQKVNLAGVKLPEGNITMVRIFVVNATVQQTPGGTWQTVKIPSGKLEVQPNALVRAQLTTSVLVDLHLVCLWNDSTSRECLVTPVVDPED